jgi:hypothetical protein
MEKRTSGIALLVMVGIVVLAGGLSQAGTFSGGQYYVWGIDNSEVDIPVGSIITEAVVTIEGVTGWDNNLHIHLLDNAAVGFKGAADGGAGDHFDNQGVLLSGMDRQLVGGNVVIRLSTVDDDGSWVWDVYGRPFSRQVADSSVVSYSSALLELIDYAGNGTPLGIGFDSDASNYGYSGIRLELTVKSYRGAISEQTIAFAMNTPAGPTLRMSKDLYGIGESIVVNHSNAEANGAVWIGLYRKGAANGSLLVWARTNKLADGSVTFAGLNEAGDYEARLFYNNNYTLAAAAVFTVAGSGAAAPALNTSKASYAVGESIVVNHSNAEENGGVWIGLYKKGAANGSLLLWSRTNKKAAGSVTFAGLSEAGVYEARLFFNNVYDLRATAEFTVSAP